MSAYPRPRRAYWTAAVAVAIVSIGLITLGGWANVGPIFATGWLGLALSGAAAVVLWMLASQASAESVASRAGAAFGGTCELWIRDALDAGVAHVRRPRVARVLGRMLGGRLLGNLLIFDDRVLFAVPDEGRRIGFGSEILIGRDQVRSASVTADQASVRQKPQLVTLALASGKALRLRVYGDETALRGAVTRLTGTDL